jgi:hypothetical protein
MKIDPQRSVAWLDKRIAEETNPRHRAIAENYRDHLVSEVTGDLDRIMSTLADQPVYHFHTPLTPMGESGPKNRDEVRSMYQAMFTRRVNVLERHFDRFLITDDCLVSDGYMDHVYPGVALLERGDTVDADGEPIDGDGYYLTSYRICAVLPYIGEGTDVRMFGEDTYTVASAQNDLRKLAPEDVPDLLR